MAANHQQAIRCGGIATGGGDDPGLNALMRALRKLLSSKHHWKVSPIPDGFDGLIWPEKSLELTLDRVSRILPRGGTILGTTNRGNPFKYKSEENGREVERDISDDILANCKSWESTPSSPLAVTARKRAEDWARTVPEGNENCSRAQDDRQ